MQGCQNYHTHTFFFFFGWLVGWFWFLHCCYSTGAGWRRCLADQRRHHFPSSEDCHHQQGCQWPQSHWVLSMKEQKHVQMSQMSPKHVPSLWVLYMLWTWGTLKPNVYHLGDVIFVIRRFHGCPHTPSAYSPCAGVSVQLSKYTQPWCV